MASNFNIQAPYVLATLPRPLNAAGTGYVVGSVWGQQPGLKRKRRPEVTIGIDGEAVNIYDIASSRLITSYPIPPQSCFSCAPCSTRWRSSLRKEIARYTYIATQDRNTKITLFKDVLGASGDTKSTNISRTLNTPSKVVHLSTISSTDANNSILNEGGTLSDLLAVTEDGSVMCFHGESLQQTWNTSADILTHDVVNTPDDTGFRVELVQAMSATDVVDGLFGGKHDVFKIFPQQVESDAFNPGVLVLVTSCASKQKGEARWLHVLVIPSPSQTSTGARLVQVHTAPIPSSGVTAESSPIFRLDISSGCLLELRRETLVTYDLSKSVVGAESMLEVPGIRSFLRISKSSVLAATSTSVDVYNTPFRALQASTALLPETLSKDAVTGNATETNLALLAYFTKLDIAVGIIGTSLIAVQLESPKLRSRKRWADGLLVDALGRGIPQRVHGVQKKGVHLSESSVFAGLLPGSATDDYWSQLTSDTNRADDLLASNNVSASEELLAEKFGITTKRSHRGVDVVLAGEKRSPITAENSQEAELPEWNWPASRSLYPRVDRRWVLFTITRVFSWDEEDMGIKTYGSSLSCRLPDSNLVNYLIYAGHLTTSNILSAFRDAMRGVDDIEYMLGEELPQLLVEIDPTFELLLAYLSSTKLGAIELLAAVRLIMRSLELVQDPTTMAPQLLTLASNGLGEDGKDIDINAESGEVAMELDRLEHQLEVTEHYLGNDASARVRGLSVAFSKLGSCPPISTIKALHRGYKPEEILSLIYMLRVELVKDGWTTRYLDSTRLDQDEDLEPPPDGSIRLIADLLCRCIDSVGPGGWLINDAILAAGNGDDLDSADFLASLRLEVSAALEAVQEAVFLRGIVSEVVRFGSNMQKVAVASSSLGRRTVADDVSLKGESAMLPFGMKTRSRISAEKVVSGGEVVNRSKREVGHLVSKKVGAYSLERITV
ncbi:hypothetical protein NKR23_g3545 [Pleurostoma richardsiae]|uniref:Utp8 beta-propeller domain-containing protein n=1 Tax=Pleurostoma richardsiae TaxID=41990 RepID=A0AA38RM75_9PEZI|nr:hypothetical protein NKR23_g3545 [Pleurostoma richardsiae]